MVPSWAEPGPPSDRSGIVGPHWVARATEPAGRRCVGPALTGGPWMPTGNILSQLGLFVRRGFLSAESCRRIRSEMASVNKMPALIRPLGQTTGIVDQSARRTGVAHVSESTVALVQDRLQATKS